MRLFVFRPRPSLACIDLPLAAKVAFLRTGDLNFKSFSAWGECFFLAGQTLRQTPLARVCLGVGLARVSLPPSPHLLAFPSLVALLGAHVFAAALEPLGQRLEGKKCHKGHSA